MTGTPSPLDFYLPPISVTPPPAEVAREVHEGNESGLSLATGVGAAALALLASLCLSVWAHHHRAPGDQIDHQVRLSLVVTLGFYLVLGVLLAAFCTTKKVQLAWSRGPVVEALLWGIPLGLMGGGLAVALNSSVQHHLASDPNVELLVGGGGGLRIALTLAVTAMLAPLIEETLFRGVLAGTLLEKGPAVAVWVSAAAFAVWHMNPLALTYYVFMGTLFATLWRKRGLVASMAAHAAFNGTLTLVAVVATTGGAGVLTHVGPVSFSLPSSWHESAAGGTTVGGRAFSGQGGAGLVVVDRELPAALTVGQLRTRLDASFSMSGAGTVVAGSEHEVEVSGQPALEADLTIQGQPAHFVGVLRGSTLYQLIMVTGGSPAAESTWTTLLSSLEVAP